MLPISINTTPCQYLFNQNAEEVFKGQNVEFVNESLNTLTQIIDHLVAHNPEALFIFDPTAFNNQCHLYALFVAQSINQTKIQQVISKVIPMPKAVDEVIKGYTEFVDRRFLYHSFFLSYAFITAPKLLIQLGSKVFKVMNGKDPSTAFKAFLNDPQHLRLRASRSALNQCFAEHMKKTFADTESPVYPELSAIAQENLQMDSTNGKGTLYTLPKFAGVVYLIDAILREKIPLLFKVKIISTEGVGSFSYSNQNVQALESNTPVIVFEMVATGDSLTYSECREIAKKCPSHSRRNASNNARHDPDPNKIRCQFCNSKRVDTTPYQKRFEPVLADPSATFLALAADFVNKNQQPFLHFFTDHHQFPQLAALFEASLPDIQRCSLALDKPLNMSVSHVYTDSAENARLNDLVIDAAYDTHLAKRGLI